MTSRSARRRKAKHAKAISLPKSQPAPHQGPQVGRPPKEDPMATVTAARQRRTGIADEADARQPICGDDMGLCIRELAEGEDAEAKAADRALLVNTWAALSASHRNYRMLIIGSSGNPQGAAIPMIPDAMETDPSLRVDLRTQEQRIESAKRAWLDWKRKIDALPVPSLRWAISGALDGFMGEGALWVDRKPTDTGRTAVQALRMVAA